MKQIRNDQKKELQRIMIADRLKKAGIKVQTDKTSSSKDHVSGIVGNSKELLELNV